MVENRNNKLEEERLNASTPSSSGSVTRASSPAPPPLTQLKVPNGSNKSGPKQFPEDSRPWSTRSIYYQYLPFRGITNDLIRRAPYYLSDWTEGFKLKNGERVIGATIRMYFLNLMPAIAYIIDMQVRTNGAYGINEGLLASVLGALVFSVFSVQPLTIVGITGLINLFNYTTFDIIKNTGIDYLQFQAWVLIWSAITHWLVAVFNICDYSRFITDMVSETFGLYVGVVYIQKGVELLILEFDNSLQIGWFSVVVAMLFALAVYFMERTSTLSFGPLWARKFLIDYSFAIGIIFFTGFVHIPGQIRESGIDFLPITKAFSPSTNRPWLVPFWRLPVQWVFAALPFGILVTLLFYFDNNVSSLMAQSRGFPVKRPSGFHWDFFLLGITTFISGILGIPAPNGLVPQAPVHTEALCETKLVHEETVLSEGGYLDEEAFEDIENSTPREIRVEGGRMKLVRTRVVEQRVSHFAMGLLALGTMTGPLLVVLGLMSRAMFAGIFIVVGWGSVEGNGIMHRCLFLIRDRNLLSADHPLAPLKRRSIAKFVGIQLVFCAAMLAISETIAGIGFPVIILLLIPVRVYYVPKFFTAEELAILDSPTANSPAVLVSLGGPLDSTDEERAEAEVPESFGTHEKLRQDEKAGLRRRNGGKDGNIEEEEIGFEEEDKRLRSR